MDSMKFTYSLRDLPLPAKLVLSLFLIAVGLGYFSAMVQLHMQHSGRDGGPMPTPDDVVEVFSGLKKYDGKAAKSKIESMLSGPREGGLSKNNMTPVLFVKSGKKYEKECLARGKDKVDEERESERHTPPNTPNTGASRKKTYEDDRFTLPEALRDRPITEEWLEKSDSQDKIVKIKTIIDERCVRCHGGTQKPLLDDYAKLEPLVTAPTLDVIDGKWVRSSRQMSIEGLTQSTHAHLLSFAVLFTLTGLTFSLTTYPLLLRIILGPIVLFAQLGDISCWWLSRVDGLGPTFALCILGFGGIVGIGLAAQIVLSLFNMYGSKGKMIVFLLFLAAGVGLGALGIKVIKPALDAEATAAGR